MLHITIRTNTQFRAHCCWFAYVLTFRLLFNLIQSFKSDFWSNNCGREREREREFKFQLRFSVEILQRCKTQWDQRVTATHWTNHTLPIYSYTQFSMQTNYGFAIFSYCFDMRIATEKPIYCLRNLNTNTSRLTALFLHSKVDRFAAECFWIVWVFNRNTFHFEWSHRHFEHIPTAACIW